MAGVDRDLLQVLVALVVVLAVGIPVFASLTGGGATLETTSSVLSISGGAVTLGGSNISDVTVNQSLGQAARLDGSQSSYVSGESEPDTSGNFTAATWVRLDDTNTTQIVYADEQRLILYNGSTGQWVGVYYEPSTTRTWTVSQLASDPTNWTHVTLMLDAGSLELIEDNTFSSTTATNDGNTTSATFTGDNLHGDLDETRVFDEPLSSSERQQLIDAPTAPLTTAERDYRIMYDSFDSPPASFPAFFVSGDVVASDVSLVDGFDEQQTTAGDDYMRSGDDISTVNGGSLDGAPALYAQWTAEFSNYPLLDYLLLFFSIFAIGYLAKEVTSRT